MPSENKKGEPKDTDAEANEEDSNRKKARNMFKHALAEFVKKEINPTWNQGRLSKELHNTIVKKVVVEVTRSLDNIPDTKEKINCYITYARQKIRSIMSGTYQSHTNTESFYS